MRANRKQGNHGKVPPCNVLKYNKYPYRTSENLHAATQAWIPADRPSAPTVLCKEPATGGLIMYCRKVLLLPRNAVLVGHGRGPIQTPWESADYAVVKRSSPAKLLHYAKRVCSRSR